MTDATTSSMPPLASPCCEVADAATQAACALCQKPVCGACRAFVNGRGVCVACAHTIRAELAAEQAGAGHLPGAIAGGVGGALVGGAAWALVAIVTNLAIGYVAIGVGFLAGYGAHLGAGKRKGTSLQAVAVACALLGLVLGKYFIVAHVLIEKLPEADLSYLDGRMVKLFVDHIDKFFEPMDILWIVLALGAAIRATRATAVGVRMPRSAR